jgi:hypothetical protein
MPASKKEIKDIYEQCSGKSFCYGCRDNILCEPGGICRITKEPIPKTGIHANALNEIHEQNRKNMGIIIRKDSMTEVVNIDDVPRIGMATELYKDVNSKVVISLHNNHGDVTIHLWDKERNIENKVILKMSKFEE